MATTDTQRAVSQDVGIASRDKYFAIFAAWLALKDCWEAATSRSRRNVVRHRRAKTMHEVLVTE